MSKKGKSFAPSNIALCKYWGKRSIELKLPVSSSISISLGNKGTFTEIAINDQKQDQIILNNNVISQESNFHKKVVEFLNLLRGTANNLKYLHPNLIPDPKMTFKINTTSNIPIAAGLASSASGFAAIVKALDQLLNWNLSLKELSILARIGSGSASRSLWHGFVKWHAGVREDGMDSFAEPLDILWPELCIGLLVLTKQEKYISSREAMKISVDTSPLYGAWQQLCDKDLAMLEVALKNKDFALLGATTEANALAMHAIMLSSRPAIMYTNADTINNINKIWQLRRNNNVELYFTQDAGPNLKLLFLAKDLALIKEVFTEIEIIKPFEYTSSIYCN